MHLMHLSGHQDRRCILDTCIHHRQRASNRHCGSTMRAGPLTMRLAMSTP
jgi:hypothetical protein